MKKYKALIMNDYEGEPYAEWIKTGEKTIEQDSVHLIIAATLLYAAAKQIQ